MSVLGFEVWGLGFGVLSLGLGVKRRAAASIGENASACMDTALRYPHLRDDQLHAHGRNLGQHQDF